MECAATLLGDAHAVMSAAAEIHTPLHHDRLGAVDPDGEGGAGDYIVGGDSEARAALEHMLLLDVAAGCGHEGDGNQGT